MRCASLGNLTKMAILSYAVAAFRTETQKSLLHVEAIIYVITLQSITFC
jgi:hypothetical protein